MKLRVLQVVFVLAMGGICLSAPISSKAPAAKVDPPKTPPEIKVEEKKSVVEQKPEEKPADGVQLQWFGHAFVYLTSRSGVRVALDPFGEDVMIPFPKQLHADVVLISYEGTDRSGGERLYGTPQIFRGVTGVGVNRASGLLFQGIETYRDASRGRELGKNTVYVFELDGMKFCDLGAIGYPLDSQKVEDIGRVDVLFLSIGNKILSSAEWREMAQKLEAKWIVPIAYYDEKADLKDLRPVEEFIEEFKLKTPNSAIKLVSGNSFVFRADEIPDKPTLLILQKPSL